MKKFYFFLVACFLMGVGAISAADSYQLHSSITGKTNWESVDLTPNGDWYEYTGTFVAGEFGIKKNGAWYGGGGANITKADTDYSFNPSSGNSKSTLDGIFTFGFNPTTNQVRMVTYSGTITETVTYAVRGTINNGGTDWTDQLMTEGEDGVYYVTKDFFAGNFGIKKMINGSEKDWYGYSALGTPKDNCTEVETDGNINLTVGGNYTISIDSTKGEVTVKFNGGEIDNKITYDLWGNLPNHADGWSATALTNVEGDIWAVKDLNVTAQSDFGIRELTNGSQSNWIWATGSNEISGVGTFACGIETKSEGANFSIAPGKWTLSFNAATMELVVTSGLDAVEGIEVEENVAPVYYNLQGVRVAEPTNGLYIVVRGDKVAKELVK